MNPIQLLVILRARYKIALFVALLTVAAAMSVFEIVQKQYTATTAVMVDIRSGDPVAGLLLPQTMMPGSMGTQVDIINSDRVARKVVRMLALDQNLSVQQSWRNATGGRGKLEDWLANGLQKGVKVTPSRDSNLINISYQGTDPVFVTAVANAFAQAYIEASIELKVEPARQYARWFGDQAKVLRENVEKAQSRLSDFQRKNDIVSTAENVDYETAKLNELSARLTAIQGENRDAQSKQRSGSGVTDTLPEVMGNPVVAGLRTNVSQLEAKLREAAGNLGSKHPQYQRMELELAELKNRLEVEMRLVTSGYTAVGAVGKTREAELQAAVAAQKKRILALKAGHDELAVLVRDVETAKKAYDAVTNRYTQTNLESQATQTNVSVLTAAVEPLEPSFPKPFRLSLLMAIALGIVLGGASAFAIEMIDHRVRSTQDLAQMLQIPVIGVITRGRRRAPRLAFWRRGTALVAR